MTPAQRVTLELLERQGFTFELEIRDIVRVKRFGACLVIQADGSQKRGHDVAVKNDTRRNAGTYQRKAAPQHVTRNKS